MAKRRKIELVARVYDEDGNLEKEVTSETGSLVGKMSRESKDAFLRDFDAFEREMIVARDDVMEKITKVCVESADDENVKKKL